MLVAYFVPAAAAQTAQLTNLTRGGCCSFMVGDAWEIDITGAPNQEVTVSGYFNGSFLGTNSAGYTNGAGNFTLTGSMGSSSIGNWSETWMVGGSVASPSLGFSVVHAPIDCQMLAIPNPPVMWSTDYYYGTAETPVFTDQGSSVVSGYAGNPQCAIVYTDFVPLGYPAMISANLSVFAGYWTAWFAYDNRTYYAYGFSARCRDCFYPVDNFAAFDFLVVDVYGNVYVMDTGVELLVFQVIGG